jgi:hypothetical protein
MISGYFSVQVTWQASVEGQLIIICVAILFVLYKLNNEIWTASKTIIEILKFYPDFLASETAVKTRATLSDDLT